MAVQRPATNASQQRQDSPEAVNSTVQLLPSPSATRLELGGVGWGGGVGVEERRVQSSLLGSEARLVAELTGKAFVFRPTTRQKKAATSTSSR